MPKVIVIGDTCKDVFIYGECKRLSPEAPVPVFNPIETVENPGMAGNVVANLKAINPDLQISFYHSQEAITKTRYVDKKTNHLFLRVDDEPVCGRIFLTPTLTAELQEADVVIVSDYNKGFLSEEDIHTIGEKSKFCILDTKKKLKTVTLYQYDFIKVNESEYKENIKSLGFMNSKVIVTLGANGARHADIAYSSPSPKETIDVSGAGDTFLAAFAIKYLETRDVKQAIPYANQLSSIVVSKKGVVTP